MLVLDGYGAEYTRSNLSQNELEPKMASRHARPPARPHPAHNAVVSPVPWPSHTTLWRLPPFSGAKTLAPEECVDKALFVWMRVPKSLPVLGGTAQLEASLFLAPEAPLALTPEPGKTCLAQVFVQLRHATNLFCINTYRERPRAPRLPFQ